MAEKIDYIKREDAIKSLVAYFEYVDYVMTKGKHEKFKVYDPPKLADDIIGRLPSADVVERKRGEWILQDDEDSTFLVYRCSECNEAGAFTNYCPNCGAKMKGAYNE